MTRPKLSDLERQEIEAAHTVTIPGGVDLTEDEKLFRAVKVFDLACARRVLAKVREACGVAF